MTMKPSTGLYVRDKDTKRIRPLNEPERKEYEFRMRARVRAVTQIVLHGQPFTWEDVDRVRHAAYVALSPEREPLHAVANRIAALLPPRDEVVARILGPIVTNCACGKPWRDHVVGSSIQFDVGCATTTAPRG